MHATPESATSDLVRPSWAERRFAFDHPPWMLAEFVERLRVRALRAALL